MEYSDRFTNFWLYYGKDEGLADKGTKSVAFDSWNTAIKKRKVDEEEFAKDLRNGYVSYIKHRGALRSRGEFVRRLKMASTFLNQGVWEEGFEQSTGEILADVRTVACFFPDCKEIVAYHGEEKLCLQHYLEEFVFPNHREIVKELKGRFGEPDGESWKEWAVRVIGQMGAKP